LLAGRTFSWRDDKDAPGAAVVNREFAREVFGSVAQAIGGYFKADAGVRIQVTGVVEDGKYKTLTEDQRTAYFLPLLQSPATATWFASQRLRRIWPPPCTTPCVASTRVCP
jgi:macrolide transport system ATP-binding/permease protein